MAQGHIGKYRLAIGYVYVLVAQVRAIGAELFRYLAVKAGSIEGHGCVLKYMVIEQDFVEPLVPRPNQDGVRGQNRFVDLGLVFRRQQVAIERKTSLEPMD